MFERAQLQSILRPKSILGVDLTDSRVRLVELRKRGGIAAARHFEARGFDIPFTDGMTAVQKGIVIKEGLEREGIRTKYACSSVRSLGVKSVVTFLPSGIDDIDEWIRENVEKLLRFPVSLREFSYAYEFMRSTDNRPSIEITFVRNADIENCRTILENAGLEMLSLGAGTRDAVNLLLVGKNDEEIPALCYIDGGSIMLTTISEGVRSETKAIVADRSASDVISDFVPQQHGNMVVAGDVDPHFHQFPTYRPYGLDPAYMLAAGLALKGFLPEISPTNLLSEEQKSHVQLSLDRTLFQRVALTLGSILVVLLLGDLIASFAIQSQASALEEQLSLSSVDYRELVILEQQVRDMEDRLGSGNTNTNYAHILHNLARATPDSVWLTRLSLDGKDKKQTRVMIAGSAQEALHVTAFLKRLSGMPNVDEANLVRSGLPELSGIARASQRPRAERVSFEIIATFNDHAR